TRLPDTATTPPAAPSWPRARMRVGRRPVAMAIPRDGKTAYVTTRGSGARCPASVTPIRTATNTALRPIHLGGCPVAIAITPNGKTAYVADSSKTAHGSEKSQVTPIPTATNTTLPPPKLTQNPQAHTVAPDSTQTCKN